jgi:predicted ATP-grasp superfamily ATP-dependent carboligase
MKKAIGIYRESVLAGKPSSDKKILDLTAEELQKKGFEVKCISAEEFNIYDEADIIFSMARGEEINSLLMQKKEKDNTFIVNDPVAIRFSFNRKGTCEKLAELQANTPLTRFVKINDLSFDLIAKKSIVKPANRHEFWFVIEKAEDLAKAKEEYLKEGIDEVIIQDFIEGEHVKYYCIDEIVILPNDMNFSEEMKKQMTGQVLLSGKATGLKIFGGDFIITPNMAYCLDVNDWPSFGSVSGITQEESAVMIANYIDAAYVYR